jgi:prophage maintenance system killer protein
MGARMELIKKHVDTVIVLGGILGAVLWMNHQFNNLDKRLTVIETVMTMQGYNIKGIALNTKDDNGKPGT